MNCVGYRRRKDEVREQVRYTKHAQKRLQQRAIPDMAVRMIRHYGKLGYHKGAKVYWIRRKSRFRLQEYLKTYMSEREFRKIDKYLACYIVISGEDVLTVGHRTRRLKFK